MLETGKRAPDFKLPTDTEGDIKLSLLKGHIVVLFFYPKDNTSGCTKEAVAFTALEPEFEAAGAKIIGLSPDDLKSHGKFRDKYDLTVTLASDENKKVLEKYGVWVEKSMYGRKYMGVERSTFLIDKAGRIAQIWRKVKVPGHAEAVLEAVRQLDAG